MTVLTLMLIWTNLGKNSFPTGYMRLTDETKVQVLFSLKTFVLVWAMLSYTDGAAAKFLGLDIEKNHMEMNKRLNQIVALGGNEVTIAPEFSFTFYAGFAAMLSFTLVKQNINFAFYFFVFNRSYQNRGPSAYLESKEEGKAFKFSNLMRLLYLNFLAPVIIVILFSHELSGSIVQSSFGISKPIWDIVRLTVVLGFIAAKTIIFREEMQF